MPAGVQDGTIGGVRAVRARIRPGLIALSGVALMATLHGQEPVPAPQQAPKPDEPRVVEAGGRLVLSGETVLVTASPDEPARHSSIATKIDTPLLETPRSITIVDRQTLDDMGAISVTQAHDYAVGITLLDEQGPGFARGFPVDYYDLRRDGLRTYSWSVREPIAIDRIQYLRGPAAVLYGDGSPGAVVNLMLKKPLPVARHQFGLSGGSAGFGRLTADLTGPMTERRRVRYRVAAAAEWLGNGYDNGERRFTLLPTLAVDLGTRGTLTVDTEWYSERGRNYRHAVPATTAAQRGDFSEYPWELSINSPDDGWTTGNVSPGARLDLQLGQRSAVHVAGRYTRINGDINGQGLAALAEDGRTALRFQYRDISTWNELQTDTFATTTVHTGRLEHRLVAGVEAGVSTADSEIGIGEAEPLDIFNPVYPDPPEPERQPIRFDVSRLGLYAIDQIRLGEQVIVVPAVRWSRFEIDDHVAAGDARSTETVLSPSLGLVVLPRRWLSLYATYARGFEPPAPGLYLEDGRPLEPAEHDSVEGGVKADVLGQRLSATGAVFGIRRTKVPEPDALGFYRQIGEAGSRGVELEVVGSVTRGLVLRGGYAFTTTEITRDTSEFAGQELPNAPRHKSEFWLRYRVPEGAFGGLMTAAGIVSVSGRFTARDNAVVIPGYHRFDGTVSYDFSRRIAIGLFGQNLSNRRYVTSGAGAVFFAGPPRRLAVQLTTSF